MANIRLKSLINEISFAGQIIGPIWIHSDGKVISVKPKNGKDFSLEELYEFTNGGPIEIVYLRDGRLMILNEEGKLKRLPVNLRATQLYGNDTIVGDVLVCSKEYIQ
jgi:hypothetical protein